MRVVSCKSCPERILAHLNTVPLIPSVLLMISWIISTGIPIGGSSKNPRLFNIFFCGIVVNLSYIWRSGSLINHSRLFSTSTSLAVQFANTLEPSGTKSFSSQGRETLTACVKSNIYNIIPARSYLTTISSPSQSLAHTFKLWNITKIRNTAELNCSRVDILLLSHCWRLLLRITNSLPVSLHAYLFHSTDARCVAVDHFHWSLGRLWTGALPPFSICTLSISFWSLSAMSHTLHCSV